MDKASLNKYFLLKKRCEHYKKLLESAENKLRLHIKYSMECSDTDVPFVDMNPYEFLLSSDDGGYVTIDDDSFAESVRSLAI